MVSKFDYYLVLLKLDVEVVEEVALSFQKSFAF